MKAKITLTANDDRSVRQQQVKLPATLQVAIVRDGTTHIVIIDVADKGTPKVQLVEVKC